MATPVPTTPDAVFTCPDCHAVLLIVMDPADPGLPAEMAAKVDGHVCDAPTVTVETRAGTRRSWGATFYRWTCTAGHTGRWTRQMDTAAQGRDRHKCWQPPHPPT